MSTPQATTGAIETSLSQLLDLPPELFERIVSFYVASAGGEEAFNRRNVCRTFRSYIEPELVEHTSPNKFIVQGSSQQARAAKDALCILLPKIVLHRVQAPATTISSTYVYEWLRLLFDTVLQVVPPDPAEEHKAARLQHLVNYVTCEPVREELIALFRRVFQRVRIDDKDQDYIKILLNVAAAIGSLEAVKHYLSASTDENHLVILRDQRRHMTNHPFLNNPFLAAAVNGHTVVVEYLLGTVKLFGASQHQPLAAHKDHVGRMYSVDRCVRDALVEALKAAILSGHVAAAHLLAQFLQEYFTLKTLRKKSRC